MIGGAANQLPDLIAAAPPSKPLTYAGTTKDDDVFHRQRIGLGTTTPADSHSAMTQVTRIGRDS